MPRDLISKKTRLEFREYFVSSTLREIEMEFEAADIPRSQDYEAPVSGQRRSLVEQYYHSLDFSNWRDARKLLRVCENALIALQADATDDSGARSEDVQLISARILQDLQKWLRKDGFAFGDGRLRSLAKSPPVSQLQTIASNLDAEYLMQQIERMEEAVDSDPWLAIGTAKELVETTCKTVLVEEGVAVDTNWDLMELWKRTRGKLKLAPDNIPNSAKASSTIKKLLSNLPTVVQGLAELGNSYGTGHGAAGKARGLGPRHARLAVGSAATLANFIFETHKERSGN